MHSGGNWHHHPLPKMWTGDAMAQAGHLHPQPAGSPRGYRRPGGWSCKWRQLFESLFLKVQQLGQKLSLWAAAVSQPRSARAHSDITMTEKRPTESWSFGETGVFQERRGDAHMAGPRSAEVTHRQPNSEERLVGTFVFVVKVKHGAPLRE